RRLFMTGLAAGAGAAGIGVASRLASRYGLIPPDWGGVWGPGEVLNYACHKLLLSPNSMAREFGPSENSRGAPVSGLPPKTERYDRLAAGGFADWRLSVDGLVARPASFSLDELKRFPATSQVTEQTCEEGWSFVAEWTGVRLSHLMSLVGVSMRAKYAVLYPLDDKYDSIYMPDPYLLPTL